ncbi:MAG: deaminase [Pirellula sp.]|nr:deaminase [Pirellula sp.]
MTSRCSVFIATSLDGFIARTDGSIDWLDQANKLIPPGEDCGFAEFMAGADALVMGRATFEQVLSFPQWYYGDKPVYVLSRTMAELPAGTPDTVRLHALEPREMVRVAAEHGHTRLYIDGGRTIQGFLTAGLIDDLTITVIPVLLGAGLRLFGELAADVPLTHVSTKAFPFGFVQSRYNIGGNP